MISGAAVHKVILAKEVNTPKLSDNTMYISVLNPVLAYCLDCGSCSSEGSAHVWEEGRGFSLGLCPLIPAKSAVGSQGAWK
jgi:hypothetical protein